MSMVQTLLSPPGGKLLDVEKNLNLFYQHLLLNNSITQTQGLTITHIYSLTVSKGQEFQQGLAESSAQGLTRLQSTWLGSPLRTKQKSVHFQTHSSCWQNQFLAVVRLRVSVVSWPSTGDCLQLVQAACSSFPHGVPQGGCLPPQDQQRRGRRIGRLQKTDTEILGNIITWLCACNHVYPTTVALFYWLEVSHRFRLHSKDGNLTRARMPIGKGPRGHLKSVCYTHVFKFLFIDSSSVEE